MSWTIKNGSVLKNWLSTVVLEDSSESFMDSKEVKPVNLKANNPEKYSLEDDAAERLQITLAT